MFRNGLSVLAHGMLLHIASSQDLPCSEDIQTKWVINDPVQFQAFSEAIKCTGEFDVEWNGRVIVDKTIQVSGGTVLNVTGLVRMVTRSSTEENLYRYSQLLTRN